MRKREVRIEERGEERGGRGEEREEKVEKRGEERRAEDR